MMSLHYGLEIVGCQSEDTITLYCWVYETLAGSEWPNGYQLQPGIHSASGQMSESVKRFCVWFAPDEQSRYRGPKLMDELLPKGWIFDDTLCPPGKANGSHGVLCLENDERECHICEFSHIFTRRLALCINGYIFIIDVGRRM